MTTEAPTPAGTATRRRTRRSGRRIAATTTAPPAPCCREGCERPREPSKGGRFQYCSIRCRVVDSELRRAEKICATIGPSPATGELWASAVEMSDALSRYHAAGHELREAARSVGITDEMWQEIGEAAPHNAPRPQTGGGSVCRPNSVGCG